MASTKDSRFNELDKVINPRWKIYVDTCSLYMATGKACGFWDEFVPILQRNNCKFIITVGTFEEIKKHKKDPDPKHADRAKTAKELEQTLYQFSKKKLDLMVTVGKPGEFHDEIIQARIRERARAYNQVYITNDLANAWDVYNTVYNSRSVDRDLKKLLIYKITKDGKLVPHDTLKYLCELNQKELKEFFELWSKKGEYREAETFLADRSDFVPFWARQNKKTKVHSEELMKDGEQNERPAIEEFAEPVIRSIINPDYDMPSTGTKLHAVRGNKVSTITLDKKIARGGEGIIYTVQTKGDTSDEYLAKIYKKTKLCKSMEVATQTMLKINYIVGNGFYKRPVKKGESKLGDHVKFPSYVLVNEDDEFVGYLMRKASGIQLSRFIADGAVESEFKRLYPGVTKKDLVEICINFLNVMKSLHSQKIIVGDLNANNILVDIATNEVYLIDADSYQYDDKFPCNVGVEKYTSPEFLKDHFSKFRTEQNELFVVARILCEILMMVDNPYNSKVAKDPIRDMVNGRFRYTFEFAGEAGKRISNKEAPGEELEIRWGQLTRSIKNAFGNTFHKDGKYWGPGERLSTTKWIHFMEDYRDEIVESINNNDGVVSNEVFPTERRKWITHVNCKVCGQQGEQEPNQFKSIIYPRIDLQDLGDIARSYHFDCYCEANWLVDVKCIKCGADMGVGMLHRDDGKDYICSECWEKVACAACGAKTPRWMLDDNGRCGKCASKVKVKCKECGWMIPKWLYDKNSGLCDRCKNSEACTECGHKIPKQEWSKNGGICRRCRNKVAAYCDCCGKYIGRLEPRSDSKGQYCEECWKPARCKSCGWDNNGKIRKWMLNKDGLCSRCASKQRSSSCSSTSYQNVNKTARQAPTTKPVQKPVQKPIEPPKKKSFFERLFGL